MARAIKQGQHIFIAFQDGEAVLDSQLRPRMYKSREQFEKSFPAWRDGEAELVEYAPTLTPPNEALTLEELREMDGVNALWVHNLAWGLHKPRFMLVHSVSEDWWTCCDFDGFETFCADDYGKKYLLYRRPPEGEEDT